MSSEFFCLNKLIKKGAPFYWDTLYGITWVRLASLLNQHQLPRLRESRSLKAVEVHAHVL